MIPDIGLSQHKPSLFTRFVTTPGRVWLALAVGCGVVLGLTPPAVGGVVFGAVALCVITLIEPRAGLVITLVIAPMKALIDTESAIAPPFDLGQMALAITLAAWGARRVFLGRLTTPDSGRWIVRWSPVYVPVGMFILFASFSLFNAISPSTALSELVKWLEILTITVMLASFDGPKGHTAGWVAGALIAAGASQALVGIYQFLGGSGAPHLWILDYRYFRAFGGFGQPNPFGGFMGITLALALGGAWGALETALRSEPTKRLINGLVAAAYGLGAAVIGAGLLVSWSRGAWLGFAAAAGALLLFAPQRRWVGVALVVASFGGLWLAIVTGIAPAALIARFTDFAQDLTGFSDVRGVVISDANYAVVERLAHWQAALGMASDAPWFGVGFGNYEPAYPRYGLVNWPMALGHAHNYYLNLLAETGILGLGAYVAMWIGLIGLTLRALRRNTGVLRGLALGLLGAWAHLAMHSLFDKLYVNNMFLHIGAMIGLIGVLLLEIQTNRWKKA